MLKKFIVFTLLSSVTFAALPDYLTVWEVRPSLGSNTNGGGFITGSSGTDMSQFNNKNAAACMNCQSATVNISTTDAVGVGTTTITSATANFSAAIVGNVVHMAGGSGSLTSGWYRVVTFTNVTTVVLDRSVAVGIGISLDIGGALSTLAQMVTNMALAAGSGAWVKATATISLTATQSFGTGMANTGYSFINGYTTTRGDNGKVTLLATMAISGGNSFMVDFSGAPAGVTWQNWKVDCDNQNFTRGVRFNSGNNDQAINVLVTNCSDLGFAFNSNTRCQQCVTTNTPSSTAAHSSTIAFTNGNVDVYCFQCAALGSTVGTLAFEGWCTGITIGAIASNFQGANSTAFHCSIQENSGLALIGAAISGFVTGFDYGEGTVDTRPLTVRNVVMTGITGFCFSVTGTVVVPASIDLSDHNACNTTGAMGFYNNWPPGDGDVTLSADPFTNTASNDFSLNNVSGGGAAVKAQGFPGVLLNGGGTGFLDMGALQSPSGGSGGGGGGSVVYP